MTWGFYGLSKTGVFPFGKNLLTNNSYDFSAVANKKFNKFYPDRGVDELVNNESSISFANKRFILFILIDGIFEFYSCCFTSG